MYVTKEYLKKVLPPYLYRRLYKYWEEGDRVSHCGLQTCVINDGAEILNAFHDCERRFVYDVMVMCGKSHEKALYDSSRACYEGLIKHTSKYYKLYHD